MKKTIYLLMLLACAGFCSCGGDEEITLPDIVVNFSSNQVGFEQGNEAKDITVSLSRAADTDVKVEINYAATGATYGTDFTFDPAPAGNVISVTVPAGKTTASITVEKKGDLFDGSEKIVFTIASADNAVIVGNTKELTLSFVAIVSEGSQMTLEGKDETSNYANAVYVDLSQNEQKATSRTSWTLGFYCGDKFRVFLNPSIQMTAAATAKTDINAVTVADTAGLPRLVASMMTGQLISLQNVDDLAGDINKTVFAEVAANANDNKVYLVAFEGNNTKPEDYYKVKVTRKGDGYSVQYGKLGGGEIKTADINKNTAVTLVGLSFTDGKVTTPEPAKWDIQWAYCTGLTTSTDGSPAAYFMQDYISLNTLGGAQAAEVIIPDPASPLSNEDMAKYLTNYFTNFNASSLSGLTFSSARNAIADKWRDVMPRSGVTTGIYRDRFYVVKDADGHYYKLRFLLMGTGKDDQGVRGRPQIEYKLVK